ncbi:MAG: BolA family transcriptional regulator [Pseudomonadota bacterium]|nr:BolA family transcriptional regulator [Pseudomonadota bacterium]
MVGFGHPQRPPEGPGPFDPERIAAAIRLALDGAEIAIEDIRGDGLLLGLDVTAKAFAERGRLDQHRLVWRILEPVIGTAALARIILHTEPSEGKG